MRSPQLAGLLQRPGIELNAGEDRLEVIGLPLENVGALAFAHGIELHELSVAHGSLENAYNQLTHGMVEYSAESARGAGSK